MPGTTDRQSSTGIGDGPVPADRQGKKLYQAIAQQLRADIHNRRVAPDGRLPSERALAEWHRVHRQTVRRALQDLREQGMIYSDRSGTYARAYPPPAVSDGAAGRTGAPLTFPGNLAGVRPGSVSTAESRWAPLPSEVASALRADVGSRALVYSHRIRDAGEIAQSSLSYFAADLVAEVPELGRAALAAGNGESTDLSGLYTWMLTAGLQPSRRDTIGVLPPARTEHDAPGLEVGGPLLAVRRTVHDQHGRTLVRTDFRICSGAAELVYESSLV